MNTIITIYLIIESLFMIHTGIKTQRELSDADVGDMFFLAIFPIMLGAIYIIGVLIGHSNDMRFKLIAIFILLIRSWANYQIAGTKAHKYYLWYANVMLIINIACAILM